MTAAPFVMSATFGPLVQTLILAAASGALGEVWTMPMSLYSRTDPAGLTGLQAWLATPLPFAVVFMIWAAALVLGGVLTFAHSWVETLLEERLLVRLRQHVHEHVLSFGLDFFTGGQTGALLQRMLTEVGTVQRLLTQALIPPVINLIVLFLALAYLMGLSWQMTVATFGLVPFALLALRYASDRLRRAAAAAMVSNRELSGELGETIAGVADIQVFNAQKQRSQRFRDSSLLAARNYRSMQVWLSLTNSGTRTFIALSTAAVLLIGIQFGTAWGLTIGGVIVFVQSALMTFSPLQGLIAAYTQYNSLVPNVVSTYELLDTLPSIKEKPGARDPGEVHGNIVFENVAFGYSPDQRVLDGTSFEIREGETVAVVGPIGSGKSTIFNLLLRFLEPQQGRIVLDGQDIADLTLHSLRTQVSKLSQFPFFLKDTVRENIRLARPEATDAEVEDAARQAHVHDVIADPAKMPLGYDTVVDVQVPSGGQKRLIALARCLLRKPEVLLLDEPTENLDAEQRSRLVDVIREYARDRTCVVISHDIDFLANVADRLLVLHEGRIAEQGTHEELLRLGGIYHTLYEVQNVAPALLRRGAPGGDGVAGAPPLAVGPLPPGPPLPA